MKTRSLLSVLCIGLILSAGCTCPRAPVAARGGLSELAGWRGTAAKSPSDFSFVVMSDRTGGHVTGEWERAVVEVNLFNPDFVICVGDLVEGYEQDPAKLATEWDEMDGIVARFRAPFFYCPGNHDVQGPATNDLMLATYVKRHGVDGRSYYSFNYRGCHFVVLNTPTASDRPEFAREMLAWLGKDLSSASDARHLFVFYHYPLWDEQKLWPLLKAMLPRGKTTIFNGHWHGMDYRDADGIPTYVLPATGAEVGANEQRSFAQVSVSEGTPRIALLPIDAVHSSGYFQDTARAREVTKGTWISSLYGAGEPLTFRQSNPIDVPVVVTLDWNAPGWTPASNQASMKVAPGKQEQVTLAFQPGPQAATNLSLKTTCEFAGMDGQPFRRVTTWDIPVCQTMEVPHLGDLVNLDAVREALKDQPPRVIRSGEAKVGELRLAVAGQFMAVSARVFDPRCTADVPEWKACNMDLYVAQPGVPTVRQVVFFPTSPTGGKKVTVYELGKEVPAPEFASRVVAAQPFGYEIQALVPLSHLLLKPDVKRFLVDSAIVAPLAPGGAPQFTLLYTGDPNRCAYRNNRYYGLARVQ